MWPCLVHARDEQSHAVGPFAVVLRVCLCAVADLDDQALDGDGPRVGHFGGQALLFHEVGEDAGVRGEAGKRDAQVVVYANYFLLVRGEFFGVALAGGQGLVWWVGVRGIGG